MEQNDLAFALSVNEVCPEPMIFSICIRFDDSLNRILAFRCHD
jgi:hypothetical protein